MKTNTGKILFMGSPDFALPTLQTLYKTGNVIAVFTRPDAPKGRGKTLTPTPIKTWAETHNIPVYTPLTKEELAHVVQELNPTLIVVIAYGMILPKTITDDYLCVNLHASILPKYRGASPIHSALLNSDVETGITAIHMNDKMDEGDMIHINTYDITEKDNLETLHDTLATLSATTIEDVLNCTDITPSPQDHSNASYCKKLHTKDRELFPSDSPQTMIGKIKAFSPRPGAFIMTAGKRVKILEAVLKDNCLIPITVQPEGKGPMAYTDYTLGHPEGLELC